MMKTDVATHWAERSWLPTEDPEYLVSGFRKDQWKKKKIYFVPGGVPAADGVARMVGIEEDPTTDMSVKDPVGLMDNSHANRMMEFDTMEAAVIAEMHPTVPYQPFGRAARPAKSIASLARIAIEQAAAANEAEEEEEEEEGGSGGARPKKKAKSNK